MAHGKNSKPLKTKCEKRHLAPASGRCSLPRCRRQVQTRNACELRPTFAPAHCSLLSRCRRHFCPRALQLAPHALPRAQYGHEPWPHLCQKVQCGFLAPTAPKHRRSCVAPSTLTSPPHSPTRCARRVHQERLTLDFWGWGVDRPNFANGKTVKDLLHECKQCCSLEN